MVGSKLVECLLHSCQSQLYVVPSKLISYVFVAELNLSKGHDCLVQHRVRGTCIYCLESTLQVFRGATSVAIRDHIRRSVSTDLPYVQGLLKLHSCGSFLDCGSLWVHLWNYVVNRKQVECLPSIMLCVESDGENGNCKVNAKLIIVVVSNKSEENVAYFHAFN